MNSSLQSIDAASFRDPSGFIYYHKGELLRQVNLIYKDNFELLINSGLYQGLVKQKLLIQHKEVDLKYAYNKDAYKVIKPQVVTPLSYAYDWSFSMLKDAALLTLKIQEQALDHGMILKDATSFNIQFDKGKPIFIDTLSFEKYEPGRPWVAYRQFCEQFLAPLVLMSKVDLRLNQLLKIYLQGIPLDLTSKLLPKNTYFNLNFFSHIHLHAKSQARMADKQLNIKQTKFKLSLLQLKSLISNLHGLIAKLELRKDKTEWGEYYTFTNYTKGAFSDKGKFITQITKRIKPKLVWDLGANDGYFSRLAGKYGAQVVAFDIDPVAVEKNYLQIKKKKETNLLPLLIDLTNPTGDYGWANKERPMMVKQSRPDMVMALALVHHLAIGNNVPLNKIAEYFASLGKYLIIEFVPKEDSKVRKLLASREDIFLDYKQTVFERVFAKYFKLVNKHIVKGSMRTLYLYENKEK